MKTTLVNEDKLFSVIGNFFSSKDNLLLELIQNAQRAHAKNIVINAPHKEVHPFGEDANPECLISIRDDGAGIKDIIALLGIAFSDWSAEIDAQQPAGMGFMQLVALSQRVYVRSKFGVLDLDSQAFMQDPQYRQEIVKANYVPDDNFPGTEIIALMKMPAWMYLKTDRNWYAGCLGIKLSLNGEQIDALGIRQRYELAKDGIACYSLCRFKGNPLLIEAGHYYDMSLLSRSLVNWYGQLIPLSFSSMNLAGNSYVRVYYEVSRGTPLTPRYPDRSSLICDAKWEELQNFVNAKLGKLLPPAYLNLEQPPRFPGAISLLSHMYACLDRTQLQDIVWVPVQRDIFMNSEMGCYHFALKNSLRDSRFCVGSMQVMELDSDGEEYNLGADLSDLKLVLVSDQVAPYLREMGVREVTELRVVNPPTKTVNLEPLQLKIVYSDTREELREFSRAMLVGTYNEIMIYAPSRFEVMDIYDEFSDEVLSQEEYRDWDDMLEEIRRTLLDSLVVNCEVITTSYFDFLPDHRLIKTIAFEPGKVKVVYRDGNSRVWQTLEAG